MNNPIPHPHAEILRAIADGKEIESRLIKLGITGGVGRWEDDLSLAAVFARMTSTDTQYRYEFRIKPEIKTGWINLFQNGKEIYTAGIWDTKEEANNCTATRIACIPIQYTPGEGLE